MVGVFRQNCIGGGLFVICKGGDGGREGIHASRNPKVPLAVASEVDRALYKIGVHGAAAPTRVLKVFVPYTVLRAFVSPVFELDFEFYFVFQTIKHRLDCHNPGPISRRYVAFGRCCAKSWEYGRRTRCSRGGR